MSPAEARLTLGVGPNADPDEIRSAFRRQAALHHPDKNPGDPTASERFRNVTEAYRMLTEAAVGTPDPADISRTIDQAFEVIFGGIPRPMRDPLAEEEMRSILHGIAELFSVPGVDSPRVSKKTAGRSSRGKARTSSVCPDCDGSGLRQVMRGDTAFRAPCRTCTRR